MAIHRQLGGLLRPVALRPPLTQGLPFHQYSIKHLVNLMYYIMKYAQYALFMSSVLDDSTGRAGGLTNRMADPSYIALVTCNYRKCHDLWGLIGVPCLNCPLEPLKNVPLRLYDEQLF